ncbi:methanogenic corrinoid protein MtbC1 [Evansella vedderi]|uniref:Methanogenic corrinoid protein MtbC1 n=1 Tax=Evansella vedderi TaxID=38282 RepID=A0ABU0A2F6_9BACI|nr:cobalamin-dependent protein [Evansella vedderi]MDQ0257670.1 methanogenic corrinoid protein MtbC1 [Evansella vedderi]
MTFVGKYNIKAVTKILGIQPGTLRAWERRYKIINPTRNQAGHRLYTENQLSILKWLQDKINQGFTIGQAVELLEKEDMEKLLHPDKTTESTIIQLRKDLLQALLNFEENRSNQLIDQAFAMFSMEKVVIQILGELLKDVGEKWVKNEITIAHEHFISAFLRTKIGMVFHHMPAGRMRIKVVTVCAPGESHELGLLIFSLFLKKIGFDTIYLGQGLPEQDILKVVEEVQPTVIFISCTMEDNLSEVIKIISQLKGRFSDLEIGIGGQAFDQLSESSYEVFEDFVIGNKQEEWANWLQIFMKNQRL